MPKMDFSYLISFLMTKFIDPVITLLLYVLGACFVFLLVFSVYTIIKFRINPFRLTPSSINRLRRMRIKLKILDFIRWLIIDIIYSRKTRGEFDQYGLTAYCGRQGAGKSISMVEYANRIHSRFPDCIIVANFDYKYADYIMQDWRDLLFIRNGKKGVLFLIDEIHSEYSSADWKDFPESLLSEISQQRKQRVKICVTSQVYSRIVKPIREQAFSVVQCFTLKGRWTFNREYDARDYEIYCDNSDRKKLKYLRKSSFIQSDFLRRCYNTYEKINRMIKISAKNGFIPRNERMA